jgi:hypothetical protein
MYIDGACHCGAIRFEAEIDPGQVGLCHCTDCQTLSGTAYRSVVPAPRAGFRLLSGEPRIYVKTAESGNKRLHAFCGNCGTPIYACAIADPPSYNLRLGTIRQRANLSPKQQNWCRSALDWAMNLEEVPRFDRV